MAKLQKERTAEIVFLELFQVLVEFENTTLSLHVAHGTHRSISRAKLFVGIVSEQPDLGQSIVRLPGDTELATRLLAETLLALFFRLRWLILSRLRHSSWLGLIQVRHEVTE